MTSTVVGYPGGGGGGVNRSGRTERARVVLSDARRSTRTRSFTELRRFFNSVLSFLLVDCEENLVSAAHHRSFDDNPVDRRGGAVLTFPMKPSIGTLLPPGAMPAVLPSSSGTGAEGCLQAVHGLSGGSDGFPPGAYSLSPFEAEQMEVLRIAGVLVAAFCRRARQWGSSESTSAGPTGDFYRDDPSPAGDAVSLSPKYAAVKGEEKRSALQEEKFMADKLITTLLHLVQLVEFPPTTGVQSSSPGCSSSRPASPSASPCAGPASPGDGLPAPTGAILPLTTSSMSGMNGMKRSELPTNARDQPADLLWNSRLPISYRRSSAMMAVSYGLGEARDYYHLLHQRAKKKVAAALHGGSWLPDTVIDLLQDLSTFPEEEHECYLRRQSLGHTTEIRRTDEAAVSLEKTAEPSAAGVELSCCRCPLRDPLSQSVIILPARGRSCSHLEFFDARNFILAAHSNTVGMKARGGLTALTDPPGMNCPFCKKYIRLDELRVDQRVLNTMLAHQRAFGETSMTMCHDVADSGVPHDINTGSSRCGSEEAPGSSPSYNRGLPPSSRQYSSTLSAEDVVEYDLKSPQITCRVVARSHGQPGSRTSVGVKIPVPISPLPPSTPPHEVLLPLGEDSIGTLNPNPLALMSSRPREGDGYSEGDNGIDITGAANGLATGSSVKRRRVDIGGHVLFVEES